MSILDHVTAALGIRRKAPEQVGAPTAPGAVDPLAHMGGQPPKVMAGIEWTGADYDEMAAKPLPPRAARNWRAPISSPTPATNGGITLSDREHSAAQAHLSPGVPDTRRDTTASGVPLRPDLNPLPEHPLNVRVPVVTNLEAAPARPKQGFTGEDPARAARYQVATFVRPFDQAIAQHPGSVTKAGQPAPLAARPTQRSRLLGGRPSASGSTPTGMQPVGPQPSTVRTVPGPWDNHLTNPGITAQTSTQRIAWRAR